MPPCSQEGELGAVTRVGEQSFGVAKAELAAADPGLDLHKYSVRKMALSFEIGRRIDLAQEHA
jgi:hypothetical protein